MNKFLFILGILLFVSCETTTPPPEITIAPDPPPDWFVTQNLNLIEGYLIGYGNGKTKQDAEAKALSNISQQLKSVVQTEYSRKQSAGKNTAGKLTYSSTEIEDAIRIRSDTVIKGTTLVKSTNSNGEYYSAYRLDNRPLIKRVADKLPLMPPSKPLRKTPKYFLPFSQKLLKERREPNYEIRYRNDRWEITTKNESFPIESADWRENFFAAHDSPLILSNIIPQAELKSGGYYSVKTSVKKAGYLTRFSVFSNGQTLRLGSSNIKQTAGTETIYPDPKKYEGLVAENLTDLPTSRDLIISVLCPKSNPAFGNIIGVTDENTTPDDKAFYKYGMLLDSIPEDCSWSARFISISKKN